MGELITDVIDLPELIGWTREAANAEMDGLLGRLLPQRDVDDLRGALLDLDVPTVEVATYRAWDTAPRLGRRVGFQERRWEVAPLGLSMKLNEQEIIRFNDFRAGLPNGTIRDVYDDALVTARACAWRMQRSRADLLVDGKVTIVENGVNVEVDWGVPGAHIVTAATAWSDTTNSLPLTNLKAWQSVYRSNNAGRNPAAWIASTDVINELSLNAQIRNLAPVTGVIPGIITTETVGQVLRAQGIAPIVPFDGEAPNPTTGLFERLINARKLIGVPAQAFGEVFVGPHAMSSNLVGRGILRRQEAPGVITWVEDEVRPASVITTSEAVALPVLRDARALFVATV